MPTPSNLPDIDAERDRELRVRTLPCPDCGSPAQLPCEYTRLAGAGRGGKSRRPVTMPHSHTGRYQRAAAAGLVPPLPEYKGGSDTPEPSLEDSLVAVVTKLVRTLPAGIGAVTTVLNAVAPIYIAEGRRRAQAERWAELKASLAAPAKEDTREALRGRVEKLVRAKVAAEITAERDRAIVGGATEGYLSGLDMAAHLAEGGPTL